MDVTSAHPDGTQLRLPRGRRGLVYPAGSGLAAVDHHARWISASTPSRKRSQSMAWPEIFNTDQASQFTSAAFTGLLLEGNKMPISMDGRGSWRDNVFIQNGYGGRSNTRRFICGLTTASPTPAPRSAGILVFYNALRPHSSLDARTPDHAWRQPPAATGGSMSFAASVGSSLRSGYALPAQRPDAGTLRNQPAGDPLIEGETLSRPSRPPLTPWSACRTTHLLPDPHGGVIG